jgi:predicted ATP-dependent endonuclease of OLD family
MIKKININNFRALAEEEVNFENGLTIIVGENDSGKSTIIDAIKLICGKNINITSDDFNDKESAITIIGEFDKYTIENQFHIKDEEVNHVMKKKFTTEHIEKHKDILDTYKDMDDDDEKTEKIRSLAELYSLTVRSNSLNDTLIEHLEERFQDPEITEDGIEITRHGEPFYFIGGQEFDDLDSFVEQFFFKEKKNDIWNENINEDSISLEEYINEELAEYSSNLKESIGDTEILEKVRSFIPDVDEIKIDANFERSSINLNIDVRFLREGTEVLVKQLGDGSKRRLTMALLDLKKDYSKSEPSIYAFDEPDVHLHVSAQLELLETINEFTKQGKQCVITTHSPFIINASKPELIRIIKVSENNKRDIQQIGRDGGIEYTFHRLGINNTNLFFSKRVILVEGKTEEMFLPSAFQRKFDVSLNSKLSNVINVEGIHNIAGFATAMTRVLDPEDIYVFIDNDGSENLDVIIDKLNIPENQICKSGEKEFEDAFTDYQLYKSWSQHIEGNIGEKWTKRNIVQCRAECRKSGAKFSKKIKLLNAGGSKMTKPEFGLALALHVDTDNFPEEINNFLNSISMS